MSRPVLLQAIGPDDLARENGVTRVTLWVTETNEPALRLDEACGFERTGQHQQMPSDPSRIEIAMRRGVLRPSAARVPPSGLRGDTTEKPQADGSDE